MNMPNRVIKSLFPALTRIRGEIGEILVHRLWNHIEIELLCGVGLLEIIKSQAFRRSIGQPFIDGDSIALGFRNFLSKLVEKQLIDEMLRRSATKNFADPVINAGIGLVVFAEHLKIDIQRSPTHPE